MRALLSVSDREGIVELAKGLTDAGAELFATDGTRTHLTEAGLEGIRAVSELTETNEILGGRVKTLHPKIFAALLARRRSAAACRGEKLPGRRDGQLAYAVRIDPARREDARQRQRRDPPEAGR